MKRLIQVVLLLAALCLAKTTTSLAVWLTTSSSLTKDECVFLSEMILDGAKQELPSTITVVKGQKKLTDYYVESKVTKMGSKFHIAVELHKTEGGELLNSYSNRTNDVDQLTDGLEKAMSGFFSAVQPVAIEPAETPLTEPMEEPAADSVAEPAAENVDSLNVVDSSVVDSVEAAPIQEPVVEKPAEPEYVVDFASVKYSDNGKSDILKPTGAGDPSYNGYEGFVWSASVASGVGDENLVGEKNLGEISIWSKVIPYLIGAGFIAVGIYENSKISDERKEYDESSSASEAVEHWNNMKYTRTMRNVFYCLGVGHLAAGAVITIAF